MIELKLNDKVLALLPRLEANDPTLLELKLTAEGFRTVDVDKLSDALKVNSTVTSVLLHQNNIGDAGMEALAKARARIHERQ